MEEVYNGKNKTSTSRYLAKLSEKKIGFEHEQPKKASERTPNRK